MEPKKVLGVLAGRDIAPGALEAWLAWADLVVAADGGADLCRTAGREPDIIVGDLDSISDPAGLTPDKDQDSSDADKLLAYLDRQGHQAVTLIGVEGDRLDHVVATLYSCSRSKVKTRVVLRRGMAFVRVGFSSEAWFAEGRTSLLPLGRCRVTFSGVRWPLVDQTLEPLGMVSLSNQVFDEKSSEACGKIALTVHEGAAVLFIESAQEYGPQS